MKQIIDKPITINLEPTEDGGLRIFSDDLPGLTFSNYNQRDVLLAIGPAIIGLLTSYYPRIKEI